MSRLSECLEKMIKDLGGFSIFQILLVLVVLILAKLAPTWSMLIMAFAGAVPDWWCTDNSTGLLYPNETNAYKQCSINGSKCNQFRFDPSMNTIVSDFELVCDSAWIPSTVTTIQMAGVLLSGLVMGQFADYFGRKPTFFIAMFFLVVLNAVAFFSVSWQMFAVVRFFLGFATGSYLTVYFPLLVEFIPDKSRPVMSGLPSWTLWATAIGLAAWLLKDWAYVHMTTAAITVPVFLFVCFVPESFRWLVAHNRTNDAIKIIKRIAKVNRKPVPDTSEIEKLAQEGATEKTENYTLIDIFRGCWMFKITLLNGFMWMACGYTYYSIAFGVQKLSGSLYLNMFLLSAAEIPGNALTIIFSNCIGRKWTCMFCYVISGLAAFGVAIVDVIEIDPTLGGQLINAFAITSKLMCSAGWITMMVLTSESYPTVVRNIGYGFMNTSARIGAIVAPQIVYLDKSVPGLMYFLCGGLMTCAAVCAVLCEETHGKILKDRLHESDDKDGTLFKNKKGVYELHQI